MVFDASLGLVAAALISYFGIDLFRRFSLKRNWVDVPNERSSHQVATPRGGGLVVATVCLVGYSILGLLAPAGFSLGYIIGATLVAAVSWLDDVYSIAFGWRLLVHFAAAALIVATCGYWQVVYLPTIGEISFGAWGSFITVIWIVWVINAYNFMDGIDGIAVIQALVAAAAWVVIASQSGAAVFFFFFLVLFGSCLGFLFHNWSPARIFMGDVGSAFLGFTFAAAPLILTRESVFQASLFPILAVLILWPFLFDTVLTIFRRLLKGKRIWSAHRDHLYQGLVIAGHKHSRVSIIYGLLAAISSLSAILLFSSGPDIAPYLISFVLFLTLVFAAFVFWSTRSNGQEEPTKAFGSDNV